MNFLLIARRPSALVVLGAVLLGCASVPTHSQRQPITGNTRWQLPVSSLAETPPPALRVLAEPAALSQNTRLALLLPLKGAYAGPSEMVREGFMAALYEQTSSRPELRLYDSGTSADALQLALSQALVDGADFIVGPLPKESVTAAALLGAPPVPMLALNYLDATQAAPEDFYQIGLAPEDEARAAAEQAVASGQRRALVLAPQNEWGERVAAAFVRRLVELGGGVAGNQRYPADARDSAQAIRLLMGLPESEERHRALMALLGGKSEFDARRRDDVDFVFLAARADQGRVVVPQLRFQRLGGLPIYATAQSVDSGPDNTDFNGVRYCDMPWMLDTNNVLAAQRAQVLAASGARSRDNQRLLALGYDAYQLVAFLRQGPLPAGGGFPAATGELSMSGPSAVNRRMRCVEISNGSARLLPSPP
jgi:hypothetical protein